MLVKWLSTKAVQFLQRSAIENLLFPEEEPRKQPFPPSFCANARPCCARGQASPPPSLPATREAPFPVPQFFGDTPFGHTLPDGPTSLRPSSVSGEQMPEGLRPGLTSQAGRRWQHLHASPFPTPPSRHSPMIPASLSGKDMPSGTPGQRATQMRLWSMEARVRSV